jgi:arginyl-tRNA synthetase
MCGYPRCRSLEQNSGFSDEERKSWDAVEQKAVEAGGSIFQSDEGLDLIESLTQFDGAIRDSFESLDPMNMTSYLFSLSHKISKALRVMPIKHESNRDSALTRLSLFSSAKTALGSGMQMLGLQPLTAM